MYPKIEKLKYTATKNFFLIAGPCVIEDEETARMIAMRLVAISDKLEIPFIYKASYKKANRSRLDSFTGIGDLKALKIIESIAKDFNIPTITDVHTEEEAVIAAEYVDVLQIPAFLCRQTELLIAAALTGKAINIKKGQFLSAESMKYAVEKVKQSGNDNILLTERGSMYGYHDLIVDYRNIPDLQKNGCPVVLDITHSLQNPNQMDGVTGGNPKFIETIAKAGIAVGVDGIFMETHPEPAKAKSDGANMLHLDLVEELIKKLIIIRTAVISE